MLSLQVGRLTPAIACYAEAVRAGSLGRQGPDIAQVHEISVEVSSVDRLGDRGPFLSGDALGRRQFLQGIGATGLAVTAGGLLAACGGSATSTAPVIKSGGHRRGGNLNVGLSGSSGSDTLDPHQGLTYLDTARAQALYQPLVQLDQNAQIEYVLAEKNGIQPHNGSNSAFVIRLRKGVTFHDGKELTADDVIFTFRRIITNKFAGANSLGPMD